MSTYSKVYKLLAPPLRMMFRLKAHGAEKIPENGGYIICANHTSLWDVFVISVSLDRQVMYMAKKELFHVPVLKSIISALGAYPVDRSGADVAAIKKTISLLEKGELVGIFPQGTRHPGENPRKTEVKHGVGLMSYRAKCGIIPVYIKTKKNHVRPFRRAELFVGDPVEYGDLGFTDGGIKEYNAAAENVFDKICTIGENIECENKRDE